MPPPMMSANAPAESQGNACAVLGVWIGLGAVIGLLCGGASALFLTLLDLATQFRMANEHWIYALPVAGLFIGWAYERFGAPIRGGNDLVIERIHDNGPKLPTRMAPMVLVGTVLTHLFGGSAGREGTAVQMGASLADAVAYRTGLQGNLRQQLLAAGAAGGFASVFGTPIAGMVFALEFIAPGRIQYKGLLPALVAAVVGDMTTHALGVGHTLYPTIAHVPLTAPLLAKWWLFAAAMAAATMVFIELTYFLKHNAERFLRRLPWRMFVGGSAIVVLWQVVGTSDYLGLGIPMIVQAFKDPNLPAYAFALKLLFTAITLSTGFLGGEVTPLFFVGATLGSVLAKLMGIPIELGAGVGLAAVFASAANAPLALSIMAVELFGSGIFPHVAIVCALAYVFSGHRGIYSTQRLWHGKHGRHFTTVRTLAEIRKAKASKPNS